ncbi:hypothetical protein PR048_017665 [Dryococelus australis]|uniref:OAR domain-containing protein n=1 Tax=Dryococelus australis TaxID=614101 RepID=A0ABQ9HA50_9NEOP|nr:hypothetical protein PR048_017665 [Dryococelus australis]
MLTYCCRLLSAGLPDFGVHAQLGLPPLPPDPFWPGAALGFGPVFGLGGLPPGAAAAALGLPWGPPPAGKTPAAPSFHSLLSQYVLAGGGLPLGLGFAPPPAPQQLRQSPPPASPPGSAPPSPPPPPPSPPQPPHAAEHRRSSIEALRSRAKEHQALLLGQHPGLGAASPPPPKPSPQLHAKS